MGTKLNRVPKTESELKGILQSLYEISKQADISGLSVQTQKKVIKYRKKLKN